MTAKERENLAVASRTSMLPDGKKKKLERWSLNDTGNEPTSYGSPDYKGVKYVGVPNNGTSKLPASNFNSSGDFTREEYRDQFVKKKDEYNNARIGLNPNDPDYAKTPGQPSAVYEALKAYNRNKPEGAPDLTDVDLGDGTRGIIGDLMQEANQNNVMTADALKGLPTYQKYKELFDEGEYGALLTEKMLKARYKANEIYIFKKQHLSPQGYNNGLLYEYRNGKRYKVDASGKVIEEMKANPTGQTPKSTPNGTSAPEQYTGKDSTLSSINAYQIATAKGKYNNPAFAEYENFVSAKALNGAKTDFEKSQLYYLATETRKKQYHGKLGDAQAKLDTYDAVLRHLNGKGTPEDKKKYDKFIREKYDIQKAKDPDSVPASSTKFALGLKEQLKKQLPGIRKQVNDDVTSLIADYQTNEKLLKEPYNYQKHKPKIVFNNKLNSILENYASFVPKADGKKLLKVKDPDKTRAEINRLITSEAENAWDALPDSAKKGKTKADFISSMMRVIADGTPNNYAHIADEAIDMARAVTSFTNPLKNLSNAVEGWSGYRIPYMTSPQEAVANYFDSIIDKTTDDYSYAKGLRQEVLAAYEMVDTIGNHAKTKHGGKNKDKEGNWYLDPEDLKGSTDVVALGLVQTGLGWIPGAKRSASATDLVRRAGGSDLDIGWGNYANALFDIGQRISTLDFKDYSGNTGGIEVVGGQRRAKNTLSDQQSIDQLTTHRVPVAKVNALLRNLMKAGAITTFEDVKGTIKEVKEPERVNFATDAEHETAVKAHREAQIKDMLNVQNGIMNLWVGETGASVDVANAFGEFVGSMYGGGSLGSAAKLSRWGTTAFFKSSVMAKRFANPQGGTVLTLSEAIAKTIKDKPFRELVKTKGGLLKVFKGVTQNGALVRDATTAAGTIGLNNLFTRLDEVGAGDKTLQQYATNAVVAGAATGVLSYGMGHGLWLVSKNISANLMARQNTTNLAEINSKLEYVRDASLFWAQTLTNPVQTQMLNAIDQQRFGAFFEEGIGRQTFIDLMLGAWGAPHLYRAGKVRRLATEDIRTARQLSSTKFNLALAYAQKNISAYDVVDGHFNFRSTIPETPDVALDTENTVNESQLIQKDIEYLQGLLEHTKTSFIDQVEPGDHDNPKAREERLEQQKATLQAIEDHISELTELHETARATVVQYGDKELMETKLNDQRIRVDEAEIAYNKAKLEVLDAVPMPQTGKRRSKKVKLPSTKQAASQAHTADLAYEALLYEQAKLAHLESFVDESYRVNIEQQMAMFDNQTVFDRMAEAVAGGYDMTVEEFLKGYQDQGLGADEDMVAFLKELIEYSGASGVRIIHDEATPSGAEYNAKTNSIHLNMRHIASQAIGYKQGKENFALTSLVQSHIFEEIGHAVSVNAVKADDALQTEVLRLYDIMRKIYKDDFEGLWMAANRNAVAGEEISREDYAALMEYHLNSNLAKKRDDKGIFDQTYRNSPDGYMKDLIEFHVAFFQRSTGFYEYLRHAQIAGSVVDYTSPKSLTMAIGRYLGSKMPKAIVEKLSKRFFKGQGKGTIVDWYGDYRETMVNAAKKTKELALKSEPVIDKNRPGFTGDGIDIDQAREDIGKRYQEAVKRAFGKEEVKQAEAVAEVKQPTQADKDAMDEQQKKDGEGLSDEVMDLMIDNPDMTEEQAKAAVDFQDNMPSTTEGKFDPTSIDPADLAAMQELGEDGILEENIDAYKEDIPQESSIFDEQTNEPAVPPEPMTGKDNEEQASNITATVNGVPANDAVIADMPGDDDIFGAGELQAAIATANGNSKAYYALARRTGILNNPSPETIRRINIAYSLAGLSDEPEKHMDSVMNAFLKETGIERNVAKALFQNDPNKWWGSFVEYYLANFEKNEHSGVPRHLLEAIDDALLASAEEADKNVVEIEELQTLSQLFGSKDNDATRNILDTHWHASENNVAKFLESLLPYIESRNISKSPYVLSNGKRIKNPALAKDAEGTAIFLRTAKNYAHRKQNQTPVNNVSITVKLSAGGSEQQNIGGKSLSASVRRGAITIKNVLKGFHKGKHISKFMRVPAGYLRGMKNVAKWLSDGNERRALHGKESRLMKSLIGFDFPLVKIIDSVMLEKYEANEERGGGYFELQDKNNSIETLMHSGNRLLLGDFNEYNDTEIDETAGNTAARQNNVTYDNIESFYNTKKRAKSIYILNKGISSNLALDMSELTNAWHEDMAKAAKITDPGERNKAYQKAFNDMRIDVAELQEEILWRYLSSETENKKRNFNAGEFDPIRSFISLEKLYEYGKTNKNWKEVDVMKFSLPLERMKYLIANDGVKDPSRKKEIEKTIKLIEDYGKTKGALFEKLWKKMDALHTKLDGSKVPTVSEQFANAFRGAEGKFDQSYNMSHLRKTYGIAHAVLTQYFNMPLDMGMGSYASDGTGKYMEKYWGVVLQDYDGFQNMETFRALLPEWYNRNTKVSELSNKDWEKAGLIDMDKETAHFKVLVLDADALKELVNEIPVLDYFIKSNMDGASISFNQDFLNVIASTKGVGAAFDTKPIPTADGKFENYQTKEIIGGRNISHIKPAHYETTDGVTTVWKTMVAYKDAGSNQALLQLKKIMADNNIAIITIAANVKTQGTHKHRRVGDDIFVGHNRVPLIAKKEMVEKEGANGSVEKEETGNLIIDQEKSTKRYQDDIRAMFANGGVAPDYAVMRVPLAGENGFKLVASSNPVERMTKGALEINSHPLNVLGTSYHKGVGSVFYDIENHQIKQATEVYKNYSDLSIVASMTLRGLGGEHIPSESLASAGKFISKLAKMIDTADISTYSAGIYSDQAKMEAVAKLRSCIDKDGNVVPAKLIPILEIPGLLGSHSQGSGGSLAELALRKVFDTAAETRLPSWTLNLEPDFGEANDAFNYLMQLSDDYRSDASRAEYIGEDGLLVGDAVVISEDVYLKEKAYRERKGLEPLKVGSAILHKVTPTDKPANLAALRLAGVSKGRSRGAYLAKDYCLRVNGKDFDGDSVALYFEHDDWGTDGTANNFNRLHTALSAEWVGEGKERKLNDTYIHDIDAMSNEADASGNAPKGKSLVLLADGSVLPIKRRVSNPYHEGYYNDTVTNLREIGGDIALVKNIAQTMQFFSGALNPEGKNEFRVTVPFNSIEGKANVNAANAPKTDKGGMIAKTAFVPKITSMELLYNEALVSQNISLFKQYGAVDMFVAHTFDTNALLYGTFISKINGKDYSAATELEKQAAHDAFNRIVKMVSSKDVIAEAKGKNPKSNEIEGARGVNYKGSKERLKEIVNANVPDKANQKAAFASGLNNTRNGRFVQALFDVSNQIKQRKESFGVSGTENTVNLHKTATNISSRASEALMSIYSPDANGGASFIPLTAEEFANEIANLEPMNPGYARAGSMIRVLFNRFQNNETLIGNVFEYMKASLVTKESSKDSVNKLAEVLGKMHNRIISDRKLAASAEGYHAMCGSFLHTYLTSSNVSPESIRGTEYSNAITKQADDGAEYSISFGINKGKKVFVLESNGEVKEFAAIDHVMSDGTVKPMQIGNLEVSPLSFLAHAKDLFGMMTFEKNLGFRGKQAMIARMVGAAALAMETSTANLPLVNGKQIPLLSANEYAGLIMSVPVSQPYSTGKSFSPALTGGKTYITNVWRPAVDVSRTGEEGTDGRVMENRMNDRFWAALDIFMGEMINMGVSPTAPDLGTQASVKRMVNGEWQDTPLKGMRYDRAVRLHAEAQIKVAGIEKRKNDVAVGILEKQLADMKAEYAKLVAEGDNMDAAAVTKNIVEATAKEQEIKEAKKGFVDLYKVQTEDMLQAIVRGRNQETHGAYPGLGAQKGERDFSKTHFNKDRARAIWQDKKDSAEKWLKKKDLFEKAKVHFNQAFPDMAIEEFIDLMGEQDPNSARTMVAYYASQAEASLKNYYKWNLPIFKMVPKIVKDYWRGDRAWQALSSHSDENKYRLLSTDQEMVFPLDPVFNNPKHQMNKQGDYELDAGTTVLAHEGVDSNGLPLAGFQPRAINRIVTPYQMATEYIGRVLVNLRNRATYSDYDLLREFGSESQREMVKKERRDAIKDAVQVTLDLHELSQMMDSVIFADLELGEINDNGEAQVTIRNRATGSSKDAIEVTDDANSKEGFIVGIGEAQAEYDAMTGKGGAAEVQFQEEINYVAANNLIRVMLKHVSNIPKFRHLKDRQMTSLSVKELEAVAEQYKSITKNLPDKEKINQNIDSAVANAKRFYEQASNPKELYNRLAKMYGMDTKDGSSELANIVAAMSSELGRQHSERARAQEIMFSWIRSLADKTGTNLFAPRIHIGKAVLGNRVESTDKFYADGGYYILNPEHKNQWGEAWVIDNIIKEGFVKTRAKMHDKLAKETAEQLKKVRNEGKSSFAIGHHYQAATEQKRRLVEHIVKTLDAESIAEARLISSFYFHDYTKEQWYRWEYVPSGFEGRVGEKGTKVRYEERMSAVDEATVPNVKELIRQHNVVVKKYRDGKYANKYGNGEKFVIPEDLLSYSNEDSAIDTEIEAFKEGVETYMRVSSLTQLEKNLTPQTHRAINKAISTVTPETEVGLVSEKMALDMVDRESRLKDYYRRRDELDEITKSGRGGANHELDVKMNNSRIKGAEIVRATHLGKLYKVLRTAVAKEADKAYAGEMFLDRMKSMEETNLNAWQTKDIRDQMKVVVRGAAEAKKIGAELFVSVRKAFHIMRQIADNHKDIVSKELLISAETMAMKKIERIMNLQAGEYMSDISESIDKGKEHATLEQVRASIGKLSPEETLQMATNIALARKYDQNYLNYMMDAKNALSVKVFVQEEILQRMKTLELEMNPNLVSNATIEQKSAVGDKVFYRSLSAMDMNNILRKTTLFNTMQSPLRYNHTRIVEAAHDIASNAGKLYDRVSQRIYEDNYAKNELSIFAQKNVKLLLSANNRSSGIVESKIDLEGIGHTNSPDAYREKQFKQAIESNTGKFSSIIYENERGETVSMNGFILGTIKTSMGNMLVLRKGSPVKSDVGGLEVVHHWYLRDVSIMENRAQKIELNRAIKSIQPNVNKILADVAKTIDMSMVGDERNQLALSAQRTAHLYVKTSEAVANTLTLISKIPPMMMYYKLYYLLGAVATLPVPSVSISFAALYAQSVLRTMYSNYLSSYRVRAIASGNVFTAYTAVAGMLSDVSEANKKKSVASYEQMKRVTGSHANDFGAPPDMGDVFKERAKFGWNKNRAHVKKMRKIQEFATKQHQQEFREFDTNEAVEPFVPVEAMPDKYKKWMENNGYQITFIDGNPVVTKDGYTAQDIEALALNIYSTIAVLSGSKYIDNSEITAVNMAGNQINRIVSEHNPKSSLTGAITRHQQGSDNESRNRKIETDSMLRKQQLSKNLFNIGSGNYSKNYKETGVTGRIVTMFSHFDQDWQQYHGKGYKQRVEVWNNMIDTLAKFDESTPITDEKTAFLSKAVKNIVGFGKRMLANQGIMGDKAMIIDGLRLNNPHKERQGYRASAMLTSIMSYFGTQMMIGLLDGLLDDEDESTIESQIREGGNNFLSAQRVVGASTPKKLRFISDILTYFAMAKMMDRDFFVPEGKYTVPENTKNRAAEQMSILSRKTASNLGIGVGAQAIANVAFTGLASMLYAMGTFDEMKNIVGTNKADSAMANEFLNSILGLGIFAPGANVVPFIKNNADQYERTQIRKDAKARREVAKAPVIKEIRDVRENITNTLFK